jgi:hypothetical protein
MAGPRSWHHIAWLVDVVMLIRDRHAGAVIQSRPCGPKSPLCAKTFRLGSRTFMESCPVLWRARSVSRREAAGDSLGTCDRWYGSFLRDNEKSWTTMFYEMVMGVLDYPSEAHLLTIVESAPSHSLTYFHAAVAHTMVLNTG